MQSAKWRGIGVNLEISGSVREVVTTYVVAIEYFDNAALNDKFFGLKKDKGWGIFHKIWRGLCPFIGT